MLADVRQLFSSTPVEAASDDYQAAIIEENLLGKGTAPSRIESWQKLHALYGLDPALAVFRCFRKFWETDFEGRPLLAVLCACARDPILRMSAPLILQASIGSVVGARDFADAIEGAAPDRFSPTNLKAIGNRICSSWAQSGHLMGAKTRKRTHPAVSPETTAYALVLGRLAGARGPLLFSTFWTALLDSPKETLYDKAAAASRRGLIELRRAGSVVDVGFSKLLTPAEQEALRESS